MSQDSKAMPAILVGGFIAGTLDAAAAFYSYGWGMPRGIASGLLGRSAFQGGTATWILGLVLHYFIALSAAAVYYAVSRKLKFLAESPVVCGLFYGIAVFLVMNLTCYRCRRSISKDRFNTGRWFKEFLFICSLLACRLL